VDLNCDMGESFGAYRIGADEKVLPYVTSANIACGFHAGDPAVMRRTVTAAVQHHVAIGAHPGLPDLPGFGRRAMQITPDEAYDMVVYQIGALQAVARAAGAALVHVKPHGALYNMAAADGDLAGAIADAVRRVDPQLVLVGLCGSPMLTAGERAGLRVAAEAFADRSYRADGSLTPRSEPNALIVDTAAAVEQVLDIVLRQRVRTIDGPDFPLRADTICLHGDGRHAAEFARAIRQRLDAEGIPVAALRP